MGNSPVYGPADADIAQDRHALQGVLQPRHDAFEVGFEEFVFRLPGAVLDPHRIGVALLVDSDEPRFLLHPDVTGDEVVVAHHREFPIEVEKPGNGIGDEVVVGHRGCRNVDPVPRADLPRIGAGGIDHVFARDDTPVGRHLPFVLRGPGDAGHTAAAHDLHSFTARHRGKGLDDAGRVDVAVVGGMESAQDPVEIVEGVKGTDTFRTDKFHGESQGRAHPKGVAQPVHLVFPISEAQ